MILHINREQYKPGRFRYVIDSGKGPLVAQFERMHDGSITLFSDDLAVVKELRIYPSMERIQKNEGETRHFVGDFMWQSGDRGEMFYCGKKGSNFLNGIYFWAFRINNQEYLAYEVGFKRKGIYLCIWNNDQTLAIISKDTHTKHFESNYTVYAENGLSSELLSVCTLFWDLVRYYPSSSSEEYHTLNTWQRELRNKYDADFIARISSGQ